MSNKNDLERKLDSLQGQEAPTPCQQERPQPSKIAKGLWAMLIGGAAATVATALFVSSTVRELPGATRSARLKLQARQAQIEDAAAQEPTARTQEPTDDGLRKAQ
jgi:hypothetical protein